MKLSWLANPIRDISNGICHLLYLPRNEEKPVFEVMESRHGSM